jgi:hypothetical protein
MVTEAEIEIKGPWRLIFQILKTPRTLINLILGAIVFIIVIGGIVGTAAWFLAEPLGIDKKAFAHTFIRYRSDGLVTFSPKLADLTPSRGVLLSTANKDVFYIGAVMHRTLSENTSPLEQKITDGLNGRFIIANPTGAYYSANRSLFAPNDDVFDTQLANTIYGFLRLKKNLGKAGAKGSIQLRITDKVFSNAQYFYDPKEKSGRLIVVSRLDYRDADEMPAFLFSSTSTEGVLETYLDSAERLWKDSEPVEDWARKSKNLEWIRKIHPDFTP